MTPGGSALLEQMFLLVSQTFEVFKDGGTAAQLNSSSSIVALGTKKTGVRVPK
jgi:hypothetical protein